MRRTREPHPQKEVRHDETRRAACKQNRVVITDVLADREQLNCYINCYITAHLDVAPVSHYVFSSSLL